YASRPERSSHLTTPSPLDAFRLDGRTAVVTGAAGGLGREIALGFAAAGALVVAVDLSEEEVAAAAADAGGSALGLDVTDGGAVTAAFAGLDRIDVLVNAAGIGGWGPTEVYPDETWERVLDVNLTGTFNCCRAAGARMIDAGRGSIVNVASTLGTV